MKVNKFKKILNHLKTKSFLKTLLLNPNSKFIYPKLKYYFNEKNNKRKEENNKNDDDFENDDDINKKSRTTYYVFSISGIIIIFVYLSISYIQKEREMQQISRSGKVTYVGKAKIGGEWTLLDHNNKPFGSKDLRGKYYLIYFGFTHCPDVCPTIMAKIAKALKHLKTCPESKYFDIEVIFVSCDPDRDSKDVIKNYCSLFDDRIIGVSGTSNNDKNLIKMLKDFKIHASKIILSDEEEKANEKILLNNMNKNMGQVDLSFYNKSKENPVNNSLFTNYSMDHTIVTYLFGQKNNFLTYLSSNLGTNEINSICLDEILNDLKCNAV